MTDGIPASPDGGPSQPSGPTPPVLDRRFGNRAGSRSYDLFVPSGHAGPLPLVVMLHGCSQTPRDFAIGTRMSALGQAGGFLVAYPSQPRSANMLRGWNWFRPGDQHRDEGEPSILAGLTRQVMEEFDVDPGRVYVAGMSSGGAAAAVMALAYPDLFAAVGIHSGLTSGAASSVGSALSAMRYGAVRPPAASSPIPTIAFHGDRDRTVAAINGEQAVEQARPTGPTVRSVDHHAGARGRGHTRTTLTDASGVVRTEHWLLHGAGHAWGGGDPVGSYTDPDAPDASAGMVRFLLAHAKDGKPEFR